jgi:CDP-paratose 2-epimerase
MSSGGPILVTGGAGFIGANLADRLASDGPRRHRVRRPGPPWRGRNLAWLKARHPRRITAEIADIRDAKRREPRGPRRRRRLSPGGPGGRDHQPDRPRGGLQVNVGGAINLLEAVRRQGRRTPVIFASTNKVYGDLADVPLEIVDDCHLPRPTPRSA